MQSGPAYLAGAGGARRKFPVANTKVREIWPRYDVELREKGQASAGASYKFPVANTKAREIWLRYDVEFEEKGRRRRAPDAKLCCFIMKRAFLLNVKNILISSI